MSTTFSLIVKEELGQKVISHLGQTTYHTRVENRITLPLKGFVRYLDRLKNLCKDGRGGLAPSVVHLGKDEEEVELLAAVENEIDEVDGDNDNEMVGLFDPGKIIQHY